MHAGELCTAKVLECRWGYSRGKGTLGLSVKALVTDDAGDESELWGAIYITEASAGMARAAFKALGVDVDKVDMMSVGKDYTIEGHECDVILDEFNGQLKIGTFGDGGRKAPSPMDFAQATKWIRDAKGKKVDAPAPAPDGKSAPGPADPDNPEDIPF